MPLEGHSIDDLALYGTLEMSGDLNGPKIASNSVFPNREGACVQTRRSRVPNRV